MAPRARKRVHALRRAPDGSAFKRCKQCGISVAVALSDMHPCWQNGEQKRRRGRTKRLGIDSQPRAPFRFFMEKFAKTCKSNDLLEVEQMGFHLWKKMPLKERHPYIIQAELVDSTYQKIWPEEISDTEEVDDEADSPMIGKFDPEFKESKDYYVSWDWTSCKRFESFDSYDWDVLGSWLVDDAP